MQAVPSSTSPTYAAILGYEAVGQMSTELAGALHITERTATAITFTVADRNGDGSPERIRYAWSGVVGAPLTRQYNGGGVVDVLADVQTFELGYDLKSVTEQYPGPVVEGAEAVLCA